MAISLDEANSLIARFGELAKDLISKRTLLESYVFPVRTYISVGLYNLYETAYPSFKKLSDHIKPEELGTEGQKLCSKINQKTHFSIMLGYLVGREQVIMDGDLSEPDALSEDREKLLFLLDLWRRMVSTYRRGAPLFVADTDGVLRIFSEELLSELKEQLSPADDQKRESLRRMLALIQSYLFLVNCESRGNIFAHGPYPAAKSEERSIVFREFSNLKSGPLSQYVEDNPPWPNLAVALELEGIHVRIDEVGTVYTFPENYTSGICSFGLFTTKRGKISSLDPREIDDLIDFAKRAQVSLFAKVMKLDRHSRTLAGALQYSSLAPYFEAGGLRGNSPSLTERCIARYLPRMLEIDTHPFMQRFSSQEKLLSPMS